MWTEVTECAPLSDLITPADQRGASFLGASPSERRAAGLPLFLQKSGQLVLRWIASGLWGLIYY